MNVFEELLVELKEENLLESTVVGKAERDVAVKDEPHEAAGSSFEDEVLVESDRSLDEDAAIHITADSPAGVDPEPAVVFEPKPEPAFPDIDAESVAATFEAATAGLSEQELEQLSAIPDFETDLVAVPFEKDKAGQPEPEVERLSAIPDFEPRSAVPDVESAQTELSEPQLEQLSAIPDVEPEPVIPAPQSPPFALADTPFEPRRKPRKKDSEFFKKRAVAEVAGLQMVDHVLTGVEREYMKVVPAAFDDFEAKKALNTLLQANPAVQAEAEFALMQETESWCSALAARDARVPVSSLRLYCENTKPALSSQALLAIARFYRNLPYSEAVRAKFDFVMTRLFSRPLKDDKRVCLFDRVESLNHINTLYGEWSSVPLYTAEDDESKVVLTALSFEDLAVEAENASAFDQLIESDFFGRIRLFKESISELFFAPSVTAAAIEANVRIGNAYVALIARERERLDADSIHSKYVGLDDQTVSDATARSLGLLDLLTREPKVVEDKPPADVEADAEPVTTARPAFQPATDRRALTKDRRAPETQPLEYAKVGVTGRLKDNARQVNRWFLAAAIVLVAASGGIWVWANYFVQTPVSTAGIAVVSVDVPRFTKHIKVAKISNETLYVQLQETWDTLPRKKRLELLQQVLQLGEREGWERVQLIALHGEPAGFAEADRIEIPEP